MKQTKKRIEHKRIKFGKGRSVSLGKYDDGYSLIMERPLITEDYGIAPIFSEVVDGKIVTQLGLTEEAMNNIIYMYNEYNGGNSIFSLDFISEIVDKAK